MSKLPVSARAHYAAEVSGDHFMRQIASYLKIENSEEK
jgi:hypothetical protein